MKTKTIPFDLELAKKIQAGEIKGEIKTKSGMKVRILCTDVRSSYPVAAAVATDGSGKRESTQSYTIDGSYIYGEGVKDFRDLVLEVPDNEPQFKPFDKVLVHDNLVNKAWTCDTFSHMEGDLYICSAGNAWRYCIPYEGNEHLVGTTNKPKED